MNSLLYSIIFIIIIITPFIYYIKDYYIISINKKEVAHFRDSEKLFGFDIISYSDTKSKFLFRVGTKIRSYFILFSKFPDIEMNFGLPNDDFTQIERQNKEFYIIKCKRNSLNEFFLTINSVNKSRKCIKNYFKIYYYIGTSFNSSKKKKKIFKCKIICTP
ncbi:MAG: hypothetical protein ACTSRP_15745 [Candidatus Helarchaeota archaeon]